MRLVFVQKSYLIVKYSPASEGLDAVSLVVPGTKLLDRGIGLWS